MNELYGHCTQSRPPVIDGLEEQIKRFVQEHRLIIIDTLQNREAGGGKVQLWQRL